MKRAAVDLFAGMKSARLPAPSAPFISFSNVLPTVPYSLGRMRRLRSCRSVKWPSVLVLTFDTILFLPSRTKEK